MKKVLPLFALLLLAAGCNSDKNTKELNFGTSPGDGDYREGTERAHFGTSPADGEFEGGTERGLNFGSSPGDG